MKPKLFDRQISHLIDTFDLEVEAEPNFNGNNSASALHTATFLAKFIIDNGLLTSGDRFIDIGASIGRLTKILLECGYDNSFALDGSDYGLKRGLVVCPLDKYFIYDMRVPFNDPAMYKYFGLTTSFEFLEHIPTNDVRNVVENISFMSGKHFCGLHVRRSAHDSTLSHYTIKPAEWWLEVFSEFGGIGTKVDLFDIVDHPYTDFYVVDFKVV
jgi:hypothetical protein